MSLVIVEGNISAGKSTLCRDLANILGAELFLEPTQTNPYLGFFYQEPKKWALTMQIWLLKQRFTTYVAALKHILETGKSVILDRSVFSDWVFAEKNRQDENITPDGFKYYEALRQQLLSCLPVPHYMIFLHVPPAECYRRVHSLRCRDVEVGIPLSYLCGLDECYQAFTKDMQTRGTHVAIYDWTSFGSSSRVSQHVAQFKPSPLSEEGDLKTFLYDEEKITRVLQLDAKKFDCEGEVFLFDRELSEADAKMENLVLATMTSPQSTPEKQCAVGGKGRTEDSSSLPPLLQPPSDVPIVENKENRARTEVAHVRV